MNPTDAASCSRLLFLAGLAVLAGSHLALLTSPGGASPLSYGGVAIGYLLLGTGAWRLRSETGVPDESPATLPAPADTALTSLVAAEQSFGADIVEAFEDWVTQQDDNAGLWRSYDQWVREILTLNIGAVRVRCFHCGRMADALRPLGISGNAGETSAVDRVVQHVATTGREFVRQAPGCAPLLDELVEESPHWDWVWKSADQGVIAVSMGAERPQPDADRRRTLRALLNLTWCHVAAMEGLRVATRTDKGSGVMTRGDLLGCATTLVESCAQEREPIVVVSLIIEGLRSLDDNGAWAERDTLVARIGKTLSRRMRGGDILGRFSDNSFVIVLRRMDLALGRLIADKLIVSASESVRDSCDAGKGLHIRAGIAGGGLEPRPFHVLLSAALNAAEQARAEKKPLATAELGALETCA